MQSSISTALRATVMVACLVAIPVLAVFWDVLPEIFAAVDEGRLPRLGGLLPGQSESTAEETYAEAAGDWFAEPPAFPGGAGSEAVAVGAVGVGAPELGAPAVPPEMTEPAPQRLMPESTPDGATNGRAGSGDDFVTITNRLRELGATYYVLETWGVRGEMYRFQCKMSVGGHSGYVRVFDASAPEALAAMSRVLYDVEQWLATAASR